MTGLYGPAMQNHLFPDIKRFLNTWEGTPTGLRFQIFGLKHLKIEATMLRLTGIDINRCSKCGKGRMVQIYELLPEYFEYIVPNKKELCNTC